MSEIIVTVLISISVALFVFVIMPKTMDPQDD